MTDLIRAERLSFSYKKDQPLLFSEVNLAIQKGETVAIVGLSGSGKSTLAFCLCGVVPHLIRGCLSGEVYFDGVPISSWKLSQLAQRIGIVFQDPETQLFFPEVFDEIAFGPENLCLPRQEILSRVEESLQAVGMTKHLHSNPYQLSGGQKQLIALAAVLSLRPEVLILDEVTSQLDKVGKQQVMKVIKSLRSEQRTLILIEHDLSVVDIADHVYVVKQGRVEEFAGHLS